LKNGIDGGPPSNLQSSIEELKNTISQQSMLSFRVKSPRSGNRYTNNPQRNCIERLSSPKE
jgi:hypothetical protein